MSKTKSRSHSTSGSYETRLVAAQSFTKGDRVLHRVTGKVGAFQEINISYALPEVWVQFESDSEISVPTSCNPLDLEPVSSSSNQQEEMPSMAESSVEVAIPVAAVEVFEELSEAEEADRNCLEHKVERAFYEAGTALRELRDKRLYRSTHKTFEEYCKDRFGFQRAYPYRLIDAAVVVDNLSPIGDILPKSESQCRPLARLEPLEQCIVWQQAVDEAGGKVPTGRIVKGIVERLKEKQLRNASDFCTIGDVFTLTRLEGAERKYNGCWAIASHINDFTLGVDVHDATILVKPENLKPIDEPDVRRQLPQTLKRIKRLRNCGLLDRCTYTVLDFFGRQTYLTALEDDLLTFLEQRYGVED